MTNLVYDSAAPRTPVATELRNFWSYRGLVRLLVARDMTVRYKRSVLGVWWTLLNPLLTSAVLWLIFSQIFRFSSGDVPFVVYLLSGVVFVTFFSQGVLAASGAIVNSAAILTKVYVPPEVFSLSAGLSAMTNFLIGIIPLVLVQIATGVGVPWTILLVPIPAVFMLALVTGIGLLVASAAVHFHDVLDLTGVLVQLVGYLVPTFYPIEIVPENLRIFILLNPVYHGLIVFRHLAYHGTPPAAWAVASMVLSSVAILTLGVLAFSRSWRHMAGSL